MPYLKPPINAFHMEVVRAFQRSHLVAVGKVSQTDYAGRVLACNQKNYLIFLYI